MKELEDIVKVRSPEALNRVIREAFSGEEFLIEDVKKYIKFKNAKISVNWKKFNKLGGKGGNHDDLYGSILVLLVSTGILIPNPEGNYGVYKSKSNSHILLNPQLCPSFFYFRRKSDAESYRKYSCGNTETEVIKN